MDDFDDDLANNFANPDEFGIKVVYTPQGGSPISAYPNGEPLSGLLTPKYEAHLDVVNYSLEFEGPTSVFGNALPGETLVLTDSNGNGTTYNIDGPPQNQLGGTTILYLNEGAQ
jgi:hypothetical protein